MNNEKLLSLTKAYDDITLCDYLDLSYSIYTKEIDKSKLTKVGKKFNIEVLSALIRFYRQINCSLNLDDDILKEAFTGKPESLDNIRDKVKEIIQLQNIRNNFSSYDIAPIIETPDCSLKPLHNINSFKRIINFSWKVNLIISNSNMNKILIPQIFLVFEFENGEKLKASISMKRFQEMRKKFTYHIKKIIDNEHTPLLK